MGTIGTERTIIDSDIQDDRTARFHKLAGGDESVYQYCLRAQRHALTKIGRTVRIRTGKNVTVTGEVVQAELSGLRKRAASTVPQFHLVLECGINRVRREFHRVERF